jgi:hypothetical protein
MLKKTRQIVLMLFCVIFILGLCTVFAHPGSLDENGGHYNRSTGEYHYHDGIHTEDNEFEFIYILAIITIVVLIVGYLCWWLYNIYSHLPHKIVRAFKKAVTDYTIALLYADSCEIKLKEIKWGHPPNTPKGYMIGSDGLPKESFSSGWGESLTVYVASHGQKVHLKKNCGSGWLYQTNIYKLSNRNISPCQKCASNYKMPDMSWYVEYKRNVTSAENQYESAQKEIPIKLRELESCYTEGKTKLSRFFMFFTPRKKKLFYQLEAQYNKLMAEKNKAD